MLFYGLEHKLDTAVNGVRGCVCLYVPPLVKRISPNTKLVVFPPLSGMFSGLRRTLFPFAFCSRSAGFNTHPRHATKQKCTTVGFHLSFVHFKRFSRDSTPGDGGGLARLGVACALTDWVSEWKCKRQKRPQRFSAALRAAQRGPAPRTTWLTVCLRGGCESHFRIRQPVNFTNGREERRELSVLLLVYFFLFGYYFAIRVCRVNFHHPPH